jgi:hypothetical protein
MSRDLGNISSDPAPCIPFAYVFLVGRWSSLLALACHLFDVLVCIVLVLYWCKYKYSTSTPFVLLYCTAYSRVLNTVATYSVVDTCSLLDTPTMHLHVVCQPS